VVFADLPAAAPKRTGRNSRPILSIVAAPLHRAYAPRATDAFDPLLKALDKPLEPDAQ
jgi:hypothetical protein